MVCSDVDFSILEQCYIDYMILRPLPLQQVNIAFIGGYVLDAESFKHQILTSVFILQYSKMLELTF